MSSFDVDDSDSDTGLPEGLFESADFACLDGSNYYIWKQRMEIQLRAAGRWRIIQDAEPRPLIDTSAPEKDQEGMRKKARTWEKRDAEAQLIIMHRLKDSELFSVHHCHTAKEVWQALRKKYEETYVGGKIYGIVGDMMSRRYVEGPDTSMMEHACAFLADNARLADMKHGIGDTTLAMMILNSVPFAPEERWTFVEPLLNSFEKEGKLEPNLVISRLVQREQTMKALASMRKQARKNRTDRLGQ